MKGRYDIRLIIAIFILTAIIAVALFSSYAKGTRQADFRVTYSGSLALREGLDPYDQKNLSPVLHEKVATQYVYPPDTLFLYRPLTFLPFPKAIWVYVTTKLLALCALLFLWNRIFEFKQYYFVVLVLAPLAYNGALLEDLEAGNVSVFEQFFIWTGFYFYTRDKLGWFAASIILAATFKFTPILFLALLLTRLQRRDLVVLGFAATFFALVVAGNALIWPQLFAGFVHTIGGIGGEVGECNPSSWALAHVFSHWLGHITGHRVPDLVPKLIYTMTSLIVISMAALTFAKLRSVGVRKANVLRICVLCFLYALVMPRFMNYSYVLLIAPSLYLIMSGLASSWIPFCGLLIIYTYRDFTVLGAALAPLYHFQQQYYSLIIASVIAGLLCHTILRGSQFVADENADSSLNEDTEGMKKSLQVAQTGF